MNLHLNTEYIPDEVVCVSSPVYKWGRIISFSLFIYSVIFFASSFVIFFIKRTYGIDPHMVSGAYPGTIQLLVFTLANIASVFSLLLGYYMYKYSDAYENIDEDHRDGEHREAAKQLEKFLRLFGAALMGSLILLFISLAVYITS